jgi:uncharacterized protein (UPF0332 family)
LALHTDLLETARILAYHDATRPKQSNLRRAVSSAYYAVFHLLIAQAVHALCPTPKRGLLMDRMSRAFQHGEMKQVCRQFQQNPLPDSLRVLLTKPVSPELKMVIEVFLDLQEARHAADYDVGFRLTREMADSALAAAELAFDRWNHVEEDEANIFLAALAFHARWNR